MKNVPTALRWLVPVLFLAVACTRQAVPVQAAEPDPWPMVQAPVPAYGDDVGAGPDEDAVLSPPGPFQGAWRVVAQDDRADAALMALTVQLSEGEAEGNGDYVLFQPFCDAVAGQPITGTSDCELIGLSGLFDRVEQRSGLLLLEFRPTADGIAHSLQLRRTDDDTLVGEYVTDEGRLRLPVMASPVPGTDTGADASP